VEPARSRGWLKGITLLGFYRVATTLSAEEEQLYSFLEDKSLPGVALPEDKQSLVYVLVAGPIL